MTERLRQALKRSASDHHRNMHQVLFYALSRDLIDLAVNRSTGRGSVPVKEILDLQAAYMTAEHEAMSAELRQ
jgi:hypothetical protein